ncbi:2-C-methyl-D-erythritol 4-phosphate cytidylyltransferase [Nitratidesulfovibrio sp. SRB-5]|uniref:2-C-methyl-D-erythritol 4-phosphate cytidylyltransferase n=1 Tax=Nitratidesulfovibrio sp. SRB-5 TaxID=2872636 RepID=UPI001CBEF0DD|nr:2-C-methyl-D-erythritol 4-phosphate cytidylyltransferase [Nitratidesulfovibrio sp. SRB-5]MBZ2171640.1 2-C-methyl-D-erythritol 4-phosphate cytidylyltransferase [Nitratidesulfovibrio sp. SRB-5]
MHAWAIVLAAGSGTRLAAAGLSTAKQFIQHRGAPLYWRSARTFAAVARVRGLVFVFPQDRLEAERERLTALDAGRALGVPWRAVAGGALRQDSVAAGLAALPHECDAVLVHDAARPFATAALCNAVLDALAAGAPGVVPGVAVTDTIKQTANGVVAHTPDRSGLVAVQTPQGFALAALRQAHERARAEGWTVTDDAALLERCDVAVHVVPGEVANAKITTPEDLAMLDDADTARTPWDARNGQMRLIPCTGWGYDVHRYVRKEEAGRPPRPMKLGGVLIPGGPEVVAHSDGDVLLHALTDALLGCIGGGDIGQHFPDTDAALDNANSAVLLDEVLGLTRAAGLEITNVDLTIIAQVPRLAPWREHIRRNVCRLLALDEAMVNVKATTEEKLGFTGEKKGLKAVAAVTGLRPVRAGRPGDAGEAGDTGGTGGTGGA